MFQSPKGLYGFSYDLLPDAEQPGRPGGGGDILEIRPSRQKGFIFFAVGRENRNFFSGRAGSYFLGTAVLPGVDYKIGALLKTRDIFFGPEILARSFMLIQMFLIDIEHDGESRRAVQILKLKAGQFHDSYGFPGKFRQKRQRIFSDIARQMHIPAGGFQNSMEQGRGGGFAGGARDAGYFAFRALKKKLCQTGHFAFDFLDLRKIIGNARTAIDNVKTPKIFQIILVKLPV